MVDFKVSDPLISNLLALQKTLVFNKKIEGASQTKGRPTDDAVRVDVDTKIEQLAKASPPLDQAQEKPTITEQEAREIALDVGQNLKDGDVPFAGQSEKTILGLFS